jgi:hypothetical protein
MFSAAMTAQAITPCSTAFLAEALSETVGQIQLSVIVSSLSFLLELVRWQL